jgi:ankyrin repeat protein
MVEVLLDAGADPNARSEWWAGSFGVLETCDPALAPVLIERGATVDAHAAARLGMADRLAALLDADPALVHARAGDGKTPLHYAATVEIARLLLDRGAAIDAPDVDHESTPAQWLIGERQDVVRLLVARGCRTDLLMAAALGDAALVRRHLDADPGSVRMSVTPEWFPMRDPRAGGTIYNWTLGGHRTAHRVARDFGHHDVFALLMERTPPEHALAVACEVGDEPLVRALLSAHPGLARALPEGERRRLALAAEDNAAESVRLMLAAGWPADARGRHGATALHWAAWHGNADAVRELLRHGAPVAARSEEHDGTPLDWAHHGVANSWHRATGDYDGVIEALRAAGG